MLLEMLALPASSKPRLRGVSHQWACLCSVPLGVALVVAAGSARARIAVTVYAISLVALFRRPAKIRPKSTSALLRASQRREPALPAESTDL